MCYGKKSGSDLFFSTGAPVNINTEGELLPVISQILAPGLIKEIAYVLMNASQIQDFEETLECNFALSKKGVGRFRVNVFRQRGEVGMVIRHIKTEIPNFETLGLPTVLGEFVMRKRGLVLVVGATDSGKSTTLASIIDYRNTNANGHIVTIEEPIEFVYHYKNRLLTNEKWALIHHRLIMPMRQAPNVILIG